MKRSDKKTTLITENETFIRLIQLAQDDAEFRKQLITILSLDGFNRKSVLSAFIENMRVGGVSDDLIEALGSLRDDDVAEVAFKVIKEEV